MSDKDNKTERPTPRRLEKARGEGQVPQSQEMLSAATLLALVGSAALLGPWFVRWSQNQIREGLSCHISVLENSQTFNVFIGQKIIDVLVVISPFLLILMVASIGANIMVSGLNFELQEVFRGVHNLQAEVVDETGKLMIRSVTNRFYVQQNVIN